MKDIVSIVVECMEEAEDKGIAKEKFVRKLIDELSKVQDKELINYFEEAYFEKSSGKTKVILSYPTKDFCPKACCSGEVDIDTIEKKLVEKIEQEMASAKGFFEEDENSIIVNINDIVGKTPNEVVKVLEEVLRQKLDEKQEKDSEGYRESKHLEFTLISNRLEEIISIKNKLGEKIYELGGCQQTTHEIAGAYKELEESFNKLIAVEARYLASLK